MHCEKRSDSSSVRTGLMFIVYCIDPGMKPSRLSNPLQGTLKSVLELAEKKEAREGQALVWSRRCRRCGLIFLVTNTHERARERARESERRIEGEPEDPLA